jgi:hypothetical protein
LKGSGEVGGNGVAPVDKKDIDDVRSTVCMEGAPVESWMSSPEAMLGVAAGSLDEYKTATLTTPFHGIVYVTGDCGPVHFDSSSGILIVHNSSFNAEIHMNQGSFRGLIIADVVNKINGQADILGGVVTIGNTESSKLGNGNGGIHYSPQVLDKLIDLCENIKKGVSEVFWKEVSCD